MVSINFLTDSFHTFFGHQVRRDDRNRSQRAQFFCTASALSFYSRSARHCRPLPVPCVPRRAHAAGTADDEQFLPLKSVHFLTPLLVGKDVAGSVETAGG